MRADSARWLIRGAERLTSSAERVAADLLIDGGVIRGVGNVLDTAGARVVQANRCLIAPGFVDVHVHGAGGDVFEQGRADGNARISAALARYGTVGIIATVATLPPDHLRDVVAALAAVRGREPGARILGIHLEGPFLNPHRCGAQNPAWMRPPAIEEIDELQRISGGLIRMVTVAPELDGALDCIRALCRRGITAAMGHTDATTEQAEAAVAAGVTHVTHLFNAMSPLHHRAPGTVGVGLSDDTLTVEVICDGHHLDWRTVDLIFRCKPADRIVMVTDAVAAALREGVYELFGARCEVRAGTVRTEGGQLAGSCLTLDTAVRNLRGWQPRRPLGDILACATTIPARIAGVAAPVVVAAGADANVMLLRDDMRVSATFVEGRCVWTDASIVAGQS